VDILADIEDVGVRDGRLSSDWGIEEMEDVAGGEEKNRQRRCGRETVVVEKQISPLRSSR
jgi:hypothetical protein